MTGCGAFPPPIESPPPSTLRHDQPRKATLPRRAARSRSRRFLRCTCGTRMKIGAVTAPRPVLLRLATASPRLLMRARSATSSDGPPRRQTKRSRLPVRCSHSPGVICLPPRARPAAAVGIASQNPFFARIGDTPVEGIDQLRCPRENQRRRRDAQLAPRIVFGCGSCLRAVDPDAPLLPAPRQSRFSPSPASRTARVTAFSLPP